MSVVTIVFPQHTMLSQGGIEIALGDCMDDLEKLGSAVPSPALRGEPLPDAFRTAADHIPGLVWTSLPDGYIDFLNLRWREFTGLSLEQSCGWGWQVAIHPDDLPGLLHTWAKVLASGAAGEAEARLRRFDGEYRWCAFRAVPLRDPAGGLLKWYGQTLDIDDAKRSEALLAGEKHLLEMLATGHSLERILDAICRLMEALAPGCMASVRLLDPVNQGLWTHAAPSLPRDFVEAIEGRPIAALGGPCAFAAFHGESAIVADIAGDTRWRAFAELALRFGLKAGFSTPIKTSEGQVLGTIALYFREVHEPTAHEQNMMGQLTRLAAVAMQRKRIDSALQESEERFRRMADATPDVMWITELEPERVVYASPSFERIWGRKVDDLYRDPRLWVEGIHPDDRSRIAQAFASWIGEHDRGRWDAEFRVVRPDGTIRWIHERGVGFANEGGPQRVSGISTDITERHLAEAALRESEERFALAVAGSASGIWDWDLRSGRMYLSEQAQRLSGIEPGPTSRLRDEWLALARPSPPDDMARRRALVADYLSGRSPSFVSEWRACHADGSYRWVRSNGFCVRDASGRATRFVGSVTDIDDRKRTEQALLKSQQRHALAMEAARDGHWDWIVEEDEYYASARMLEIYGLPADTRFNGRQDFMDRFPFHPEDRSTWQQAIAEHFAGKTARFDLEMRMIRHGEVRWIQQSGLLSRDTLGRPIRWTGSVRDVTDRKAGEAALRESEQRFALAVAGSNDGIWDLDLGTDDMFMSERAQRLCGLVPGIAVRPGSQWSAMAQWHPDDAVSRAEMIDGYLAGRVPAYDGEWRIRHADGSYRWVRIRGVCIRDPAGRPTRMAGSISDIDPQKCAEAALLQAQRLEATGTLAGGIAHDFNNILAAILGYGGMALRDVPAGTRLRRDLDSILVAAERGRSLVDRILAFSRSSVSERSLVHVEAVVREALDQLSATLPEAVRIDARLSAGQAAMLGDATQIHQVLMNLATNAIQAMPSGGTLTVWLRVIEIKARQMATTGAIAPGEYLRLELADQGHGIAPEVLARIFDPFFSTKDVGVGTGLGLSLVHGIVTDLGGAVDVSTRVGGGSVFTVYLPRAGDAPQACDVDLPELPRGQRQRVLVVDDEASLVTLMSETLSDLGYEPYGHTSSATALAAFQTRPEAFDAVITDERMPGLSGSALVREMRRLRADMPILLVSGFLGATISEQARAAGASEVLQKPLAARELALALARVVPPRPQH